MIRHIPLVAAFLFLAACGFTPMYGSAGDSHRVQSVLNDVEVDVIPNREGQYLRNRLIDRFHTAGTPRDARYRLVISTLEERRTDLDITKTADSTRAQLRVGTRMRLVDNATGSVVLVRDISSVTSTNILPSQFTTRVSEDNARLNAIDDLARQAEQQIVLFLARTK